MNPHSALTFTATPNGILVNGAPLTKNTSRNLPSHMIRYVERAQELLGTVKQKDWDDRTSHNSHNIPPLARAKMLLALASPCFLDDSGQRSTMAKTLTKDDGDVSGDDEEDDGEGDDSGSAVSNEDDSYSGGGGHYNPDEPRIPAGQPGGGQWTTGDGTSTDAGSISADDIRSTITDSDASSPVTVGANNPQKTLADSNGDSVIDPNTGNPYPMPDGMDIAANVKAAEDYDPDALAADKALSMIYWFSHGGPQDYQRPDGYIPALFGDIVMSYRNVTNYNYGAVAAAMEYSLDETLTAAGAYNQAAGRTNADDMSVTYGIRNDAVRNITQGFQDYLNGKWTTEKK